MSSSSSFSYDRLPVRCFANFVIFYAASSISEALRRRRKNKARRKAQQRRLQKSNGRPSFDAVDYADNGENENDDATLDRTTRTTTESHLRSLRFALFGAIVHAPACSLFFGALDAALPGKGPREVAAKLLADRATLAPALLLVVLFWMLAPPLSSFIAAVASSRSSSSSSSAPGESEPALASSTASAPLEVEGNERERRRRHATIDHHHSHLLQQLSSAADDARRRLPRAYLLSCLFWVPAHSLGFAVVTARWRVLYVALATLLWNVVLAGISSGGGGSSSGGGGGSSGGGVAGAGGGLSAAATLPLYAVSDAHRKWQRKERWSG